MASSPSDSAPLPLPPPPPKASRGRPRKVLPVPIDNINPSSSPTPSACPNAPKRLKRKRAIADSPLDPDSKSALAAQFSSEIDSLIKYYHEDGKIRFDSESGSINRAYSSATRRLDIALLIEESSLPFSRLVAHILQKLSADDEAESDLTLASLRSAVLSMGERICFGIPKSDADVLEDESDSCLWCWEVRDIKLLPDAQRSSIATRRRKRRKISERLVALSAMLTALTASHNEGKENIMLATAEEALSKAENEVMIRASVCKWQQKKAVKEMQKEVKLKEKEALKEQLQTDRENEKQRKRLEKEEERKKLQAQRRLEKEEERKRILQEKERERLEKEASKEWARSQKEALRQEKGSKRQQDDVEKELKRKEKEAADLRKQAALQKQAVIMGRFLKSKKDQAVSRPTLEIHAKDGSQPWLGEPAPLQLTHEMDQEMLDCCKDIENLLSSHLAAWKNLHDQFTASKFQRWGCRRFPKMSTSTELRLQGGSGDVLLEGATDVQMKLKNQANLGHKRSRKELEDGGMKSDKTEADWEDSGCMLMTDLLAQDSRSDNCKFLHPQSKKRKLLQFDKSHRPAYYGSLSKKSEIVRPRNPLKKDPNLEYEVDSDEEWEEEDPGESLSDCDKDEDDEQVDVEDDDENADGFVVPDGYLSESEGAHVDDADSGSDSEVSVPDVPKRGKVPTDAQTLENQQGLQSFARQRKVLEHLTDQALRSNRPYIICNFLKDRNTSASKTERLCLEALKIQTMTGEISVEAPVQEYPQQAEANTDVRERRKPKVKRSLPDTALREMVEILMSSSHGLKKCVDILSERFPSASRSQLQIKIKEICDFVDNHWQVKKEIVENLGLKFPSAQAPSIPETVAKSPALQLKPITKFFSKRCLPPEKASVSDCSPEKRKDSSNVLTEISNVEAGKQVETR